MGCLFEFFMELLLEGVLSIITAVYEKLTEIIVPEKEISNKEREKIKNTLKGIFAVLMLCLVIGVFLLLPDNQVANVIGKFMTFIPLTVIGIQVILGIIVLIHRAIKKKQD